MKNFCPAKCAQTKTNLCCKDCNNLRFCLDIGKACQLVGRASRYCTVRLSINFLWMKMIGKIDDTPYFHFSWRLRSSKWKRRIRNFREVPNLKWLNVIRSSNT